MAHNASHEIELRVATFLAPNMLPVYEFIVDAIGRELGSGAELVVGDSFDQFGTARLTPGSSAVCRTSSSRARPQCRSSCWRRQ